MNKLTIQLIKKLWGIDLEQLKADNQALTATNEQLRIENEQRSANIEHLTQMTAQLESQMQQLEQEMEMSQTNLEQQKALIHQQQTELTRREEETRSLKSNLEAEIQQKATTIQQLEAAAKEEAAEATARVEAAEAEMHTAQAEAETARKEYEKAKEKVAATKAEAQQAIAETEKAKAEAQQAIAETEKAKAEAQQAIAETEKAKAEAQQAITEKEKAKAEAQQAITETEKAKAEAQQAITETEKAKAEAQNAIAESEKAKEEAQNAIAEKEKAKAEVETLQANVEQLTASNNDLIHQLSALEALRQQQTDTIQQLQIQVKKLEDKNAALQTTVKTAVVEKQATPPEPRMVPLQQEDTQAPAAFMEKAPGRKSCQAEKKTTREEKPNPAKGDILEAYQEMKAKLEESTLNYPFTRITTVTHGNQYLYYSRTLGLKAELFVWGIEGREVVLDEPHFIPYNEIANIEGLETPFATEPMDCDFSDKGNATEVAETLLTAICRYQPIHVTYRDKNGRISERNLYWISFLPENKQPVTLPNPHLFEDMFADNIDTDYLLAMCAHYTEPRIFIIDQILSLQVYNVFATNRRGIEAQLNGYRAALACGQEEAAEMIYYCLPEQFRSQLSHR